MNITAKTVRANLSTIVFMGLLATGGLLLLHGATLTFRTKTELRQNQGQIEAATVGYRSPFSTLMSLLGIGGLGYAAYMGWILSKEEEELEELKTQNILAATSLEVVDLPTSSAPLAEPYELSQSPPLAISNLSAPQDTLSSSLPNTVIPVLAPEIAVRAEDDRPAALEANLPDPQTIEPSPALDEKIQRSAHVAVYGSPQSKVSVLDQTTGVYTLPVSHGGAPIKLSLADSLHRLIISQVERYKLDQLVAQLANNDRSILFAGPPGSGKSTIVRCWIKSVLRSYPNAIFLAAGAKSDAWMGLTDHPGFLKTIQRGIPDPESLDNLLYSDCRGILDQLNILVNILHSRNEMSVEARRKQPPVWLIVDDYVGIYNQLSKAGKEWFKKTILFIITVGREARCGVCIGTQSFNVEALGVDANTRAALTFCITGKVEDKVVTTEDGRQELKRDGSFDVITNALKNPIVIPGEIDRVRLIAQMTPNAKRDDKQIQRVLRFAIMHPWLKGAREKIVPVEKALKDYIAQDTINIRDISVLSGLPLVLTTLGNECRLGLMPNLVDYGDEARLAQDVIASHSQRITQLFSQYSRGADMGFLLQPPAPDPEPLPAVMSSSPLSLPKDPRLVAQQQFVDRLERLNTPKFRLTPAQINIALSWVPEDPMTPSLSVEERQSRIKRCLESGVTSMGAIICMIWDKKPGGSEPYAQAKALLKETMPNFKEPDENAEPDETALDE